MEGKYSRMTVNERLYVSGLLDKFDAAVKARKASSFRNLLQSVDLDEESIKVILEQLGL